MPRPAMQRRVVPRNATAASGLVAASTMLVSSMQLRPDVDDGIGLTVAEQDKMIEAAMLGIEKNVTFLVMSDRELKQPETSAALISMVDRALGFPAALVATLARPSVSSLPAALAWMVGGQQQRTAAGGAAGFPGRSGQAAAADCGDASCMDESCGGGGGGSSAAALVLKLVQVFQRSPERPLRAKLGAALVAEGVVQALADALRRVLHADLHEAAAALQQDGGGRAKEAEKNVEASGPLANGGGVGSMSAAELELMWVVSLDEVTAVTSDLVERLCAGPLVDPHHCSYGPDLLKALASTQLVSLLCQAEAAILASIANKTAGVSRRPAVVGGTAATATGSAAAAGASPAAAPVVAGSSQAVAATAVLDPNDQLEASLTGRMSGTGNTGAFLAAALRQRKGPQVMFGRAVITALRLQEQEGDLFDNDGEGPDAGNDDASSPLQGSLFGKDEISILQRSAMSMMLRAGVQLPADLLPAGVQPHWRLPTMCRASLGDVFEALELAVSLESAAHPEVEVFVTAPGAPPPPPPPLPAADTAAAPAPPPPTPPAAGTEVPPGSQPQQINSTESEAALRNVAPDVPLATMLLALLKSTVGSARKGAGEEEELPGCQGCFGARLALATCHLLVSTWPLVRAKNDVEVAARARLLGDATTLLGWLVIKTTNQLTGMAEAEECVPPERDRQVINSLLSLVQYELQRDAWALQDWQGAGAAPNHARLHDVGRLLAAASAPAHNVSDQLRAKLPAKRVARAIESLFRLPQVGLHALHSRCLDVLTLLHASPLWPISRDFVAFGMSFRKFTERVVQPPEDGHVDQDDDADDEKPIVGLDATQLDRIAEMMLRACALIASAVHAGTAVLPGQQKLFSLGCFHMLRGVMQLFDTYIAEGRCLVVAAIMTQKLTLLLNDLVSFGFAELVCAVEPQGSLGNAILRCYTSTMSISYLAATPGDLAQFTQVSHLVMASVMRLHLHLAVLGLTEGVKDAVACGVLTPEVLALAGGAVNERWAGSTLQGWHLNGATVAADVRRDHAADVLSARTAERVRALLTAAFDASSATTEAPAAAAPGDELQALCQEWAVAYRLGLDDESAWQHRQTAASAQGRLTALVRSEALRAEALAAAPAVLSSDASNGGSSSSSGAAVSATDSPVPPKGVASAQQHMQKSLDGIRARLLAAAVVQLQGILRGMGGGGTQAGGTVTVGGTGGTDDSKSGGSTGAPPTTSRLQAQLAALALEPPADAEPISAVSSTSGSAVSATALTAADAVSATESGCTGDIAGAAPISMQGSVDDSAAHISADGAVSSVPPAVDSSTSPVPPAIPFVFGSPSTRAANSTGAVVASTSTSPAPVQFGSSSPSAFQFTFSTASTGGSSVPLFTGACVSSPNGPGGGSSSGSPAVAAVAAAHAGQDKSGQVAQRGAAASPGTTSSVLLAPLAEALQSVTEIPMLEAAAIRRRQEEFLLQYSGKLVCGNLDCQNLRGLSESALETTLKACPCRQVHYCHVDCQRRAWPHHKKVCPVALAPKEQKAAK